LVPKRDWSRAETGDALGPVEAGALLAGGAADAGAGVAGTAVAVPPHAANTMAAVATNPPRRFRI
jgi:hypothetical protein